MKKSNLSIPVTVILFGVFACAAVHANPASAADVADNYDLKYIPCHDPEYDNFAQCGTIKVYEDRKSRSGRKIEIYFMVVRALSKNPKPDANFRFFGGPGVPATLLAPKVESYARIRASENNLAKVKLPAALALLKRSIQDRDTVYVDFRGSGHSNGLDCYTSSDHSKGWSISTIFETDTFDIGAMAECRKELVKKADLSKYMTSWAVDDVDDVRTALGYDKINIRGSSYGSRFAFEYLRRHGAHVRTATLQYVAPSFNIIAETRPGDVEKILEIVIDECKKDKKCNKAFPDVRANLDRVLKTVRQSGAVPLTLKNPATGINETVSFRYNQIANAIRYTLYGVALQAQLPLFIHEAANGNFRSLAITYMDIRKTFADLLNEGYWASIICSEEYAVLDFSKAASIAEGTMMGRKRLDAETQICMNWPKAEIPQDFHEPVRSTVPVLLINGDRDAASPIWLAQEAIKYLPNGRLVKLINRSHLQLPEDTCILSMWVDFIEKANTTGVDASCAANLKHPPFATSLNDIDPHFWPHYPGEDESE